MKHVSELTYQECVTRQREIEVLFAATKAAKDEPETAAGRAILAIELKGIVDHMRALKEQTKQSNLRRNYAGIGFPFHAACVDALAPDVVARLEADALVRLDARLDAHQQQQTAKRETTADDSYNHVPEKIVARGKVRLGETK